MQFPSITEITDKAQEAFKRFPVTLAWAILGSGYVIYLIEDFDNRFSGQEISIVLTLVLGVSWLIAAQFFLEQQENPKKWIWTKVAVLLLLFIFYWHLPRQAERLENPEYIARFCLYFLGGHLFVCFAPFLKKFEKSAFWNYLKSVGIAIGRSVLFSGVLYLGLVLALLAVDALFEVNIPDERYGQLFVFCLGIVNTWMYLSDFPVGIRRNTEVYFEKVLDVFVTYILIPLVLLYVVILYAYGLKILVQWELPQGWVSYLVTALALLGFLVQVIINPVQRTSKAWTIRRFHPWFYILLLPLTVLLLVAILRRVSDYGITENRYFVLVIASWIVGMSLYLLLGKKKNLTVLPISLFLLSIWSSFGFWGAFSISRNSQIGQFEKVFEAVKLNNDKATADQFEQLTSILDYLKDRKSLGELHAITASPTLKAFKDSLAQDKDAWFNSENVLDSMGITIRQEEIDLMSPDGTHYSYYGGQNRTRNDNIEGFSYFSQVYFNIHSTEKYQLGKFIVGFDPSTLCLYLASKNEKERALEIPLRKKLLSLTKYGRDLHKAPPEEMVMEAENDSISVRLIFAELNFSLKQDSITQNSGSVFLFLKKD